MKSHEVQSEAIQRNQQTSSEGSLSSVILMFLPTFLPTAHLVRLPTASRVEATARMSFVPLSGLPSRGVAWPVTNTVQGTQYHSSLAGICVEITEARIHRLHTEQL